MTVENVVRVYSAVVTRVGVLTKPVTLNLMRPHVTRRVFNVAPKNSSWVYEKNSNFSKNE